MPTCPCCHVQINDDERVLDRCPECGHSLSSDRPIVTPDLLVSSNERPAHLERPHRSHELRADVHRDEFSTRRTPDWPAGNSPGTGTVHEENSQVGSYTNTLTESATPSRHVTHLDERGVEGADYLLIGQIGQGALGDVYRARQVSLNRDVALKTLKGPAAQRPETFINEAVTTAALEHPNICPVYDLATTQDGTLFMAMKQIEGRPWSELLEERAFNQHENLDILMKVCDAIRFAHDRGVIHRDIKPNNVMIGQYGEVAVMDWGIAMRLELDGPQGSAAPVGPAGTPAYMAPEMAAGVTGDIGPWSDVYLLGAVLYEILTGEPPHPAPTDSKRQHEVLKDALLIAARNEISPIAQDSELNAIAYRAMATEVQHRYQSIGELQDAIREHRSHIESIALADHAREHLTQASVSESPQDYDRALTLFEEALNQWPDNHHAKEGIRVATIAYAEFCLKRGAYDRGIALLSEDNSEHTDLLRKLRTAWRRTKRLSALLKAAVLLIIVGSGTFSFFLYRSWDNAETQRIAAVTAKHAAIRARDAEAKAKVDALAARDEAVAAQQAALEARAAEEQAKEDLLIARDDAILALKEAERQMTIAESQRHEAEHQREIARSETKRARDSAAEAMRWKTEATQANKTISQLRIRITELEKQLGRLTDSSDQADQ